MNTTSKHHSAIFDYNVNAVSLNTLRNWLEDLHEDVDDLTKRVEALEGKNEQQVQGTG